MTVSLHQQAFAGFSNTNADNRLARGAAVGFSEELSPILNLWSLSFPILTALARHSSSGMGVPVTDLSELGADTKQIIRVVSSPAILAMGLPRKGARTCFYSGGIHQTRLIMDRNLLLLVKMEYTEGVWKLNFVLSLTDAILEVISARGTPFTVLTDSVAIRQKEDLLADQIGLKSDELRKMEQLVLLVKALRALKLPLLFARGEIRVGHLKSSNAVKNVLNDLNSRYHQCLET
ncbi:uncharacterized protein LOC113680974, partial [Pocillopora damicornis]|uniref:uncharacterized protein LOC113680974 n=1 Tax=Pocillopora damicornis TaxID=46731 RepID=UPI000F553217